jgi:hypothetical protein
MIVLDMNATRLDNFMYGILLNSERLWDYVLKRECYKRLFWKFSSNQNALCLQHQFTCFHLTCFHYFRTLNCMNYIHHLRYTERFDLEIVFHCFKEIYLYKQMNLFMPLDLKLKHRYIR